VLPASNDAFERTEVSSHDTGGISGILIFLAHLIAIPGVAKLDPRRVMPVAFSYFDLASKKMQPHPECSGLIRRTH